MNSKFARSRNGLVVSLGSKSFEAGSRPRYCTALKLLTLRSGCAAQIPQNSFFFFFRAKMRMSNAPAGSEGARRASALARPGGAVGAVESPSCEAVEGPRARRRACREVIE